MIAHDVIGRTGWVQSVDTPQNQRYPDTTPDDSPAPLPDTSLIRLPHPHSLYATTFSQVKIGESEEALSLLTMGGCYILPEILQRIFKMLTTDLPAIALTCKAWTVIVDNPSFYIKIFPSIARGHADWVKLLNVDPGVVPRLPRRVHADLAVIEEKGGSQPLLTLIPKTIRQINEDGSFGEKQPLTKQLMRTLVKNPISGYCTKYHDVAWQEAIDQKESSDTSYWELIDTKVIGRSCDYSEQETLAKAEGQGANLPRFRGLIVSVFMDFVKNGIQHSMFDPSPISGLQTWIRVEGETKGLRRSVGFFPAGLRVDSGCDFVFDFIGVVASRKSIGH